MRGWDERGGDGKRVMLLWGLRKGDGARGEERGREGGGWCVVMASLVR